MKKLLLTILLLTPFIANAVTSLGDVDRLTKQTIKLSCTPPTERADNTKLNPSEIAGFNFYSGSVSGRYGNKALSIGKDCAYTFNIDASTPLGETYGVVTTVDSKGVESTYSAEVSWNIIDSTAVVVIVNTPAIITGTKTGKVTEDLDGNNDGLLGAVGRLKIVDPDTGEALFIAEKVTTKYGTLSIDASGKWFYGADKFNADINALNKGQRLTDTATVKSVDGTQAKITITIYGVTDVDAPPKPVSYIGVSL